MWRNKGRDKDLCSIMDSSRDLWKWRRYSIACSGNDQWSATSGRFDSDGVVWDWVWAENPWTYIDVFASPRHARRYMVLCLLLSTRQWRLNELAMFSRLVRNGLSLPGPDNEKVVIKPDSSSKPVYLCDEIEAEYPVFLKAIHMLSCFSVYFQRWRSGAAPSRFPLGRR